ncbi:hypothetical protein BP422_24200 [Brevibacillus formosus]|uniref:Uncharacterized protein n=1 Tax=Brevibacillus formosus TaxID=54913 RepID=A0A220MNM7_9BACL|nr:hypothetical protein [Brevibacillus formosus]ASJ56395.1 hypothetical protein BP422_24200 [Brevibacillus formosus]
MMYEHIMRVGMTINDKNRGCIIVGGVDPTFSSNNTKIRNITDRFIMVKSTTEELKFKVKKIDLSTSITGNLSIGISIYDSDDFIKIKAGDEVLLVLD